jgi:hypothetical protein
VQRAVAIQQKGIGSAIQCEPWGVLTMALTRQFIRVEAGGMMAKKGRRYAGLRVVFAVLFVLSTCVLLYLVYRADGPGVAIPESGVWSESGIVAMASLLTAVTSLIGLLSTTILGWRRERRETRQAALERERHELEIQKLRQELDRSGPEDDAAR